METEMHTKISLATLDEESPFVKVSVPGESVTAEVLIKKAASQLGLKSSSIKYLALFEGLEKPTKKYRDIDEVDTRTPELSIQKWCFDIQAEKKNLMKCDDAALKFLYMQAKSDIKCGKLKPSEEQKAQLEEYCDPEFPVPMQYIKLCQTLDNYTSAIVRDCTLHKEFLAKSITIPAGTAVNVAVTRRGLMLEVHNRQCVVSWRKVKGIYTGYFETNSSSWTRAEEDVYITYEIYSVSNNNFTQLHIKSKQAPYLLAVTLEMIRILQEELDGPPFQTSDIQVEADKGEIVAWNNVMFTTKSTALEGHIAGRFVDMSA